MGRPWRQKFPCLMSRVRRSPYHGSFLSGVATICAIHTWFTMRILYTSTSMNISLLLCLRHCSLASPRLQRMSCMGAIPFAVSFSHPMSRHPSELMVQHQYCIGDLKACVQRLTYVYS